MRTLNPAPAPATPIACTDGPPPEGSMIRRIFPCNIWITRSERPKCWRCLCWEQERRSVSKGMRRHWSNDFVRQAANEYAPPTPPPPPPRIHPSFVYFYHSVRKCKDCLRVNMDTQTVPTLPDRVVQRHAFAVSVSRGVAAATVPCPRPCGG